MKPRFFCIAIAGIILGACGGGSEVPQDASSGPAGAPPTSSPPAGPASSPPAGPTAAGTANQASDYDRKTFVLCPALEDYRDELASIVGFTQRSDRGLAAGGMKCKITGKGGDFIGVEVLPAMVNSIERWADAFDGPASPAPELGADARFVASDIQPYVAFKMNPLIIAVNAENLDTPDRKTMITLAMRVREVLLEANPE